MLTKETDFTVFAVTGRMLNKFNNLLNTSRGKSLLANLRNSIGKPLSQTIELWPMIFEELPEGFLGKNIHPSKEEKAILATLQLYAIHQQGMTTCVFKNRGRELNNIGTSLRRLRTDTDRTAMDRRFNAMITAATFDELIYHLRHLIRLLKAKSLETKVNYPQLAHDLYWFLRGYEENLRLSWAREYYRTCKGDEDNDEN